MPFITASPYYKYYYKTGGAVPSGPGDLYIVGLDPSFKRLGIPGTIATVSPIIVGTYAKWNSVQISSRNGAAIDQDGFLYIWGYGAYGVNGDGSTFDVSAPAKVGSSQWKSINLDTDYAIGIDSLGRLFSWGTNTNGDLALNDTYTRFSPNQVGSSFWTQATTTHAIRSDGTLWGWGSNIWGDIGVNDLISRSSPVQIGTDNDWKVIKPRYALKDDGRLYAWGYNYSGALGTGDPFSRSSPVQLGTNSWSDIDTNMYTFMGITSGKLYASGTLPNTTNVPSWNQIATGPHFALGIKPDGSLWGWGRNEIGQLGLNSTIFGVDISPTQVGTSSWIAVAAGDSFSVAIRSDGKLFTFGANNYGQLGLGNYVHRSSPTQVGTNNWAKIAAGASAAFGITTTGTLFAWGGQNYGVLGNGWEFTTETAPRQLGSSSWTFVAAGLSNTSAIRSDGKLFIWGGNASGQLGINSALVAGRSSPVQLGTNSWSMVTIGNNHIAAIRSDNKLFVWGDNGYGQIGTGPNTIVSYSSPVQIGTSNWTNVAGGEHSTYAVSNSTLFTWGRLQRTWDSLPNMSSPVQVAANVDKVYARSTSLSNIYAVRNYMITKKGIGVELDPVNGSEVFGTSYSYVSSPVQIGTEANWAKIYATPNGAYLYNTAGVLYSWGSTPEMLVSFDVPNTTPMPSAYSGIVQISASGQVYGYIK